MIFYGLEILDEISVFVFTIFFAIIIALAWMSTKVDCDFRHVRTIILEANHQRINNYRNNSVQQRNLISIDDLLSTNFEQQQQHENSSEGDFGEHSEAVEGDSVHTRVHGVAVFSEELTNSSIASSSNYHQRLSDNKADEGSPRSSLSRNIIRMKIKYLDDREKWVFSDIKQTILAFKRDNFSEELTKDLNVRLIYNGQELKEENDSILEQYGLANNCTIHCLVTQPRSPLLTSHNETPSTSIVGSDRSDIEIGGLMFPLFGALLTVIWYCRICYRHYFNVVTTFALIGMTIIYLIACITCLNFGRTSYTINNHHRSPRLRTASTTLESASSSSTVLTSSSSSLLSSSSAASSQTTRISFTSTFSSL